MSAHAPQVLSRRTNGLLPAGATQTNESSKGKAAAENSAARPARMKASSDRGSEAKSTNDADTPRASRTKTPSEGEKLVIRRLPPGMTQDEFTFILGPEWETGKGKVDWFYYARGKISNDPSKPSRPGRAYIHLMRKDYIVALSEIVRAATWEDARHTFTNPSLIGPPSLEFAAYKKVPGNKKRSDARQGTIDQDPEFMAFLEALANPTPLRESIDNEETEEIAKTEVTTTPLIEYLKEKKANKSKEAAVAKSAKHRQETSTSKGKSSAKEEDGSKPEKAPSKETVKILTKKAATEQAAEVAKNIASQITSATATSNTTTTEAQPKSRRAGIAQAARILQRDLGLSPGSAHRRARQDAAKAEVDPKPSTNGKDTAPATNENQSSPAQPAEPTTTQPAKPQSTASAAAKSQSSSRRGRGNKTAEKGKNTESTSTEKLVTAPPVILKKKSGGDTEAAQSSTNAPSAPQTTTSRWISEIVCPPKKSVVSPNVTRGFVKHANPSQGITEAVLKQALETFGTITFIEMDKRKGFAYVDFSEHAGLVKAVSASPVTVAQGTVQVLERKDKKPASSNGAAAPATPAATSSSTTAVPTEKGSTSRGRRGRGGGAKSNAATNGNQATATTNGTSTTNGGG
ncbi:hypothetical protein PT974_00256 [Cladobotryum mycophilum]|uniref:RRM domain-containing protein n=1 Tax=Cladobotryum mycophilum TaxID=491253 RepID=A0ABR0T1J6_9HYPO